MRLQLQGRELVLSCLLKVNECFCFVFCFVFFSSRLWTLISFIIYISVKKQEFLWSSLILIFKILNFTLLKQTVESFLDKFISTWDFLYNKISVLIVSYDKNVLLLKLFSPKMLKWFCYFWRKYFILRLYFIFRLIVCERERTRDVGYWKKSTNENEKCILNTF